MSFSGPKGWTKEGGGDKIWGKQRENDGRASQNASSFYLLMRFIVVTVQTASTEALRVPLLSVTPCPDLSKSRCISVLNLGSRDASCWFSVSFFPHFSCQEFLPPCCCSSSWADRPGKNRTPEPHRLLEGDVVSVCFSEALPVSGKEIDNKGFGKSSSSWLLSPSFYFSSQLTAVVILSTWMGWHAFLPLKLSCFVNYFVRNLPGGLVVRTLHFHFRGDGFRELRSCKSHDGAKKEG